jgi:hypothetical protein
MTNYEKQRDYWCAVTLKLLENEDTLATTIAYADSLLDALQERFPKAIPAKTKPR